MDMLISHSLRDSKLYHLNTLYHQNNVPGPHDLAGHRRFGDDLCCNTIFAAFREGLYKK